MIVSEIIWPEWQILREIGRGSSGIVYEAVRRDYGIEAHSAIKVIPIPEEGKDPGRYQLGISEEEKYSWYRELVDDVIREIQVMQILKGSPNIVGIEDYKLVERTDTFGWDICIRMELLTSLPEWSSDRELSEADAVRLGEDICKALEICGNHGILHRDIKPENIFVDSQGEFKLGDFGVSKKLEVLTTDMTLVGTTNYMAPEVFRGEMYNQTADLYSLGLVLYRILNRNRLPFLPDKQILSSSERSEAFRKRLQGDLFPPPCNASQRMAEVIQKACAYRPEERFQTASEFLAALETEKLPAPVPHPPDRKPDPKKRQWRIAFALTALFMVAVVTKLTIDPPPPPPTPSPNDTDPEIVTPLPEHGEEIITDVEPTDSPENGIIQDVLHPGEDDLKGSSERLVHPNEESWLKDYETQYVKTKYGNLAYLRYEPEENSDHYDTVSERDQVTALARQNGYTLVITENGLSGWVTSKVLVNQYD